MTEKQRTMKVVEMFGNQTMKDEMIELQEFVKAHLTDDVNELALQAARYPAIDMKAAIRQIRGHQIAREKLPLWAETPGILFPDHLPMEQCSSWTTARYKAEIVQAMGRNRGAMADLTAGFGVDATALGREFDRLIYVERNPDLCQLAANNLPLLGVKELEIRNDDCESVLPTLPPLDLIFIDPARRDTHGRKTVAIADCTPDVCTLQHRMLETAAVVMTKLSPMLDLQSMVRDLIGISQIHIVSVDGECKEVLVIQDGRLVVPIEGLVQPIEIVCANLSESKGNQFFRFCADEEKAADCRYAAELGQYLYEPNASVMKAAPFRILTQRFDVRKLHANSHLYTSDALLPDFPGRAFRILGIHSLGKSDIRQLKSLGKANLTVRNFPATVADLRKRLGLRDGGATYLFATTLQGEKHVIIRCEK